MSCKCTCGNCCTHGKAALEQKQAQNEIKNRNFKEQAKKRADRQKAAFYRPK